MHIHPRETNVQLIWGIISWEEKTQQCVLNLIDQEKYSIEPEAEVQTFK